MNFKFQVILRCLWLYILVLIPCLGISKGKALSEMGCRTINCVSINKKDSIAHGRVVGITDGDTFKLLFKNSTTIKVRVANIDCPERKQPFSKRAKQLASKLIFNQEVKIIITSKDRYGRYIANVYCEDKNLGEELLKNGLAWHFVKYSSDTRLQALENEARENKVGVWSSKNPIAPWDWRKGIRN